MLLLPLLLACSEEGTEHVFVKLRPDVADVAETAVTVASLFDVELIHTFDEASEGFSTRLPPYIIPLLETRDEVEWIEADPEERRKPEPPGGDVPGGDEIPDVSDPPPTTIEVDADEIPPELAGIGGPFLGALADGVEVAVLDTGVDDHRDLNVVAYVDFVERRTRRSRTADDPDGHGTHVAGTIGAKANRRGIVGVAPGVPIHALRVLDDDGTGVSSDTLAALEYVLEHPEIRVVNLSLGGPRPQDGTRDPVRAAIRRLEQRGVVVVVAAGNDRTDTENVWPAGYDLGLTVSAADTRGASPTWAEFTNYGAAVDVAAPGVGIQSTLPNNGYGRLSGTSMATPHVAGAAAAILSLDPSLTPDEVRARIVSEADAMPRTPRHDEGLLQVPQP